jgi:hypothetical protein
MTSGLLVVSRGDRVQLLNSAAAAILGVDAAETVGRSYRQGIANPAVSEYIERAIGEEEDDAVADFVGFAACRAPRRFERRALFAVREEKNEAVDRFGFQSCRSFC